MPVRKATVDDVHVLGAMIDEAMAVSPWYRAHIKHLAPTERAAYYASTSRHFIEDSAYDMVVAVEDNVRGGPVVVAEMVLRVRPVKTVKVEGLDVVLPNEALEVCSLAVHRDHQRMGHGSSLLAYAQQRVADNGLDLCVAAFTGGGQALLRKTGFVPVTVVATPFADDPKAAAVVAHWRP